MISNEEIGLRIKNLRKEKNISQEELGEKIGISKQAVSYLESGRNQVSLDILDKLHTFFNISIDELFYGETKENEVNNKENNENIEKMTKEENIKKETKRRIKKDPLFLILLSILILLFIVLLIQIIYACLNPIYYNYTTEIVFWFVFIDTNESTIFLIFFIIFSILFLIDLILLFLRVYYVIKKKN